jgi:hypothetical protein
MHNTDTENTLVKFNSVHLQIKFTIEKETQNKLNYLDTTITNLHNQLMFDIYRKPTCTNLIIHNDSCHPQEHKNSAIKYPTMNMNTYPTTNESRQLELQHIKTIPHNNNYPSSILQNIHKPHQRSSCTKKQKNKNGPPSHTSGKKLES